MSEISASRLLKVWAIGWAADFSICLAAAVAVALLSGDTDLFRALASGAMLFVFVYFVAGFILTSAIWRLIANQFSFAPPVIAIGSSVLLIITVTAMYLGTSMTLLEPVFVGAVALHGIAVWRIAARDR